MDWTWKECPNLRCPVARSADGWIVLFVHAEHDERANVRGYRYGALLNRPRVHGHNEYVGKIIHEFTTVAEKFDAQLLAEAAIETFLGDLLEQKAQAFDGGRFSYETPERGY